MFIVCPSCRHAIRVIDLRPGRFTPRCPRCERVFQMTVPDEKGRSPVIVPLDPSVFAEPVMLEPAVEPHVEIPELFWPIPRDGKGRIDLRPAPLPRGVPRFLGRHVLLKLLGSGPRGQAFLGLPLSLGNTEVIKVQAPDRAAQRVFLSRFAREAFAASQIDHPNLAAIRDLGLDRGQAFTAVEHVRGPSLGGLLLQQPSLEPFQAAVLILQAARGLKAAHEQGLWHRDVKPENLRLDPHGLVKVDDLGLEMTPSLAEALAHQEKPKPPPVPSAPGLAGSPAYMAPEQAADPSSSDGRADIYALGGTLYHLVTGKPPFTGESAVELFRQHREERLVPPREFVPTLPRPIADIIQTMLGKRLDERYPTMAAVVDVLENALEVHGEKATAQVEEAGESFLQAADALAASPARQLRLRIMLTSGAIVMAFACLLIYLKLWAAAAGIVGFAALTGLIMAIVSGITHRSELLGLVSAAVLGSGRQNWAIVILMFASALGAFWFWGGFLPWFLLFCAGGVTAAFHVFLDRPLAREREAILSSPRERLKTLRARGHDEETLRSVLVRHGGANWRELFEPLLGRRATLPAHEHWEEGRAARRGIFPSWGDLLYSLLEKRLAGRCDRQLTRLLEQVEAGRLEASGVNLLTARRKARRSAKAMVISAQAWRDQQRLLAQEGRTAAPGTPTLLERLHRAANAPEPALEPHEPASHPLLRRIDSLLSILLGRWLRFLLGSGLLVLFAVWLDASGVLTFQELKAEAIEIGRVVDKAVHAWEPAVLRELRWSLSPDWRRLKEPLDFSALRHAISPELPAANLSVATLILWISLFSGRKITGLLALLGAAVSLFGVRWGVAIPALSGHVDANAQVLYLGAILLLIGLFWPRHRTTHE